MLIAGLACCCCSAPYAASGRLSVTGAGRLPGEVLHHQVLRGAVTAPPETVAVSVSRKDRVFNAVWIPFAVLRGFCQATGGRVGR